jgi:hypothetical protein
VDWQRLRCADASLANHNAALYRLFETCPVGVSLNFEREKGPATVMSAGCRPRQRQRSGHSYSRQKNIQYSRSAPTSANTPMPNPKLSG